MESCRSYGFKALNGCQIQLDLIRIYIKRILHNKRIKLGAEKSVSQAGGKALDIPLGNLVLFHDHLEGHNNI